MRKKGRGLYRGISLALAISLVGQSLPATAVNLFADEIYSNQEEQEVATEQVKEEEQEVAVDMAGGEIDINETTFPAEKFRTYVKKFI